MRCVLKGGRCAILGLTTVNKEVVQMEFSGHELATRAENFRWNIKQLKYMLEEEGESLVDFA